MRKKSASGVLASLRGSTYGLGKRLFTQAMGRRVNKVYVRHFARCGLAGRRFCASCMAVQRRPKPRYLRRLQRSKL